jgi:hypothetical protein
MHKIFSCNSESICIICTSTSSLHTFQMVWIMVQCHRSILVSILILFKLDVTLSSIAVDHSDQLMVGCIQVAQAPCVTIYCLFELQGKEESIALKLEVVSLARLFDGSSLDYHFDVGFGATSALHHLGLGLRCSKLDWCGLLGGDEVLGLFNLIFFIDFLLCEFVPRFVIIEHRGDVTLQLVCRLRVLLDLLFIEDITLGLRGHLVDLNLVPDWWQWDIGPGFGSL